MQILMYNKHIYTYYISKEVTNIWNCFLSNETLSNNYFTIAIISLEIEDYN